MARNTGRRQQNRPAADWNHFYVYGSAVRQPEALPSGNGSAPSRRKMEHFKSRRKKEQAVR